VGLYNNTPLLVTGGAGFIGSHLVRRLVREGARVHVVVRSVSSVYPERLKELRGTIELHEASLTDETAVEVVFHLGAFTHVGKSWLRASECMESNIGGTLTIIRAAFDSGKCRRMVNVGTSEIYGDASVPFRENVAAQPVSPYAVSKYAAERLCELYSRAAGAPIVRVRPFNAYGPWQSVDRVVPEIICRALRNLPVLLTGGTQTREFNFVEDLVDGLLRASITPNMEGRLVNLGCGEEWTIGGVAEEIVRLTGSSAPLRFGTVEERPIEIRHMYADANLARETLGWEPRVSLIEGLVRTIAWYREEYEKPMSAFVL
jgi:UDP-glucose 4-epimerase